MGIRFAKIRTVVPSVLMSAALAGVPCLAFADDPSIDQHDVASPATTGTITGAAGCDPSVEVALSNANVYNSQQQTTAITGTWNGNGFTGGYYRTPTSYFGCLQGLINEAGSLLNMFTGTGSLSIGGLLTQLAQAAVRELLNQLSQQVCQALSSVTSGGITTYTNLLPSGGGSNGAVPGVTVTSLLGQPPSGASTGQFAPLQPNYKVITDNSQIVQSDDSGDLNWLLQTGGGSATVKNTTLVASGAGNEYGGSGSGGTPTPVTGPIPAGDPTVATQSGSGLTYAVDYMYPGPPQKHCLYSHGFASWRTNNPGSLAHGAFTKSQGEIGTMPVADNIQAVFPDPTIGTAAKASLLKTRYSNLTIQAAMTKYCPYPTPPAKDLAHQCATGNYPSIIQSATGAASTQTVLSTFSDAQWNAMFNAIERQEGGLSGRAVGTITCQ